MTGHLSGGEIDNVGGGMGGCDGRQSFAYACHHNGREQGGNSFFQERLQGCWNFELAFRRKRISPPSQRRVVPNKPLLEDLLLVSRLEPLYKRELTNSAAKLSFAYQRVTDNSSCGKGGNVGQLRFWCKHINLLELVRLLSLSCGAW